MSDTEDEPYDKEAEKERLREQLRREEENRRSTEHMSELLLKGATMTNKHCDTCGDPIFRYQGQEFCPTCAQEGTGGDVAVDAEGTEDAEGTQGPAGGEEETTGAAGIDRVETGSTDEAPGAEVPGAGEPATPVGSGPRTGQRAGGVRPAPTGGDTPEDVAAARAALVRKLTSLARGAEATEDVGRSRELLAAAREAAEALAAIDELRS